MGNESMYERPKNHPTANLANKVRNKSNKQKEPLKITLGSGSAAINRKLDTKPVTDPFASLIVHNGRQFPPSNIVQRKGNHLDKIRKYFLLWMTSDGQLWDFVTEYRKILHSDTNYSYHYLLLERIESRFNICIEKNGTDTEKQRNALKKFIENVHKEMDFVERQVENKQKIEKEAANAHDVCILPIINESKERVEEDERKCCGGCNVI
jgi:hypothetical protein